MFRHNFVLCPDDTLGIFGFIGFKRARVVKTIKGDLKSIGELNLLYARLYPISEEKKGHVTILRSLFQIFFQIILIVT